MEIPARRHSLSASTNLDDLIGANGRLEIAGQFMEGQTTVCS